jgi:hypothetical protein
VAAPARHVDAGRFSNGAVHAVATDHVARADRAPLGGRAGIHPRDVDMDELGILPQRIGGIGPQYLRAELLEARLEHRFRDALRHHQGVPMS